MGDQGCSMRLNLHTGNTHFSSYSFIHAAVAPNILFVLVDDFLLIIIIIFIYFVS